MFYFFPLFGPPFHENGTIAKAEMRVSKGDKKKKNHRTIKNEDTLCESRMVNLGSTYQAAIIQLVEHTFIKR